jgi:hypothetical protein
MSAGALKSWISPLLLILVMASVVCAADDCPDCKDFLNNPHAKVIMTLDETTQNAEIVVYYENFTATPARQPVGDSIIIVELTNTSGDLRQLYKTYTDADGKALFNYADFAKPCVNIKALYCPFCTGGGTECGFAQCLSYSKIHNESTYYSNIANLNIGHDITLASDIPDAPGRTPPAVFNPNLYFPDLGTVQYCAPPVASNLTPPLCLPLIIIFSLLSGALYMSGRNPLAAFSLGGARVGRHIRYQARGRGFSMNVQSLINAASSIGKIADAGKKGEIGKRLKADAAANSPGKLVNMAGSKMGLAAMKETNTMTKGQGANAKAAYMDAKMEKMRGGDTSPGLRMQGGQMVQTPGSSGAVRGSDFTKVGVGGKVGFNWGAIGMFVFSQSAIGRMVDGFRTMSDPKNTMWSGYVASAGLLGARAANDKVALAAMTTPTGGLKVPMADGSILVLKGHSDGTVGGQRVSSNTYEIPGNSAVPMRDASGNVVKDASGKPIMMVATTVTVKSVAATDASGNVIMGNSNAIQVNGKDVVPKMENGKPVLVNGVQVYEISGTMRVNKQDVQPGPMVPTGKVGADGRPEMQQTFIVIENGKPVPAMLNAKNELVVNASFNTKGEVVGGTVQKVTTDGTSTAMLNANGQLVVGATVTNGKVEGGVPVPMTVPTRVEGSGSQQVNSIPTSVASVEGGTTNQTLLSTGVKEGKLVTFEPQMRVESTTVTYVGPTPPAVPGKPAPEPATVTVTLTPTVDVSGKPQSSMVMVSSPMGMNLTPKQVEEFQNAGKGAMDRSIGDIGTNSARAMEMNSTTLNAINTYQGIQESGMNNAKSARIAEEQRAQEMIANNPTLMAEYKEKQKEVATQVLANAIGVSGATSTRAGQEYMAQVTGGSPEGVLRTVGSTVGQNVLGSEEKRFEAASTVAASAGMKPADAPAVAIVMGGVVKINGSQTLDQLANTTPFSGKPPEIVQAVVASAVASGTITQAQVDAAKTPKAMEALANQAVRQEPVQAAVYNAMTSGQITPAQGAAILANPKAMEGIAIQVSTAASTTLSTLAPAKDPPLSGVELVKLPVSSLSSLATTSTTMGLDNPKNEPAKISLSVYDIKPSSNPELQTTMNYQQTLRGAEVSWERIGGLSKRDPETGTSTFDTSNMLGATKTLDTRTVEFSTSAQAVNVVRNLSAEDYLKGNETPYQKAEIESNVDRTKKLFVEYSTKTAEISRQETYMMSLPYQEPKDPSKPSETDSKLPTRPPASIEEARVAFDQHQNRLRSDFLGALNPNDPDKSDYRLASERANQLAESSTRAGDTKGSLLWGYQGSIVAGVGRDQEFRDDAKAQEAFKSVPNVEGIAPGGYFVKDAFKPQEGESKEDTDARRQDAYRKVVGQVKNDVTADPATGGWAGYNPDAPSHRHD